MSGSEGHEAGRADVDRVTSPVRLAVAEDVDQLIALWRSVYEDDGPAADGTWEAPARRWFADVVADHATARFPVVEVGGDVVATAIGTLKLGVPNPHCPRGRTVRLANVITSPEHRRRGFGTLLVEDVVRWARAVDADRVDLSATPDGLRVYERAGFELTRAPRMKLVLR